MSASLKIKKNIGRGFLVASFFLFAFLPMTATFAQQLTPAGMSGISWVCGETQAVDSNGNPIPGVPPQSGNCTFADLMNAIRGIANFAVVNIALPFSVIVIIYVGAEYMIYSDNPTKRSAATKRFEKVAWGIFWVLAAWLVINMIMTTLTVTTGQNAVPQFLNNS
jgi:hypothetical protein